MRGLANIRGAWFLIGFFALLSTPLEAASDYRFFDPETGNEVLFPQVDEIYTLKRPGPWKPSVAQWHLPVLKPKFRKEGLENVRMLELTIPHPMDKAQGEIQAVYLKDKDGLLIGYQEFPPLIKNYQASFRLNGVINYVQIYVFCSRHGAWETEVRLPLA